ncbi:MAG TPA: class I SAM-dependent methyltransferase [Gemmataceae bacterium]|nr:class I SAM-dependent methyltransferase [Gemmataceae bacterium]
METLVKRAVRKVGKLFSSDAPPRRKPVPLRNPYSIQTANPTSRSAVDEYWGDYTIKSEPFATAQETLDFHQWRSDHFHKSYEFKGFWDDHRGKVLLDYGCGPGHDLLGFSLFSKPAKIYGIDISHKALSLAGHNVGLHNIPPDRLELIQTGDLTDRIPLPDASVDYVHCCGVVHHTSKPEVILREFHRVLKPGGRGLLMAYNRNSIFFHLYVAYARRFLDPQFSGCTADQVFAQSTDGPKCPVSRCYEAAEFSALCASAGFDVNFVGGFVACNELDLWHMHAARALQDYRLVDPHKAFLKELDWDEKGLPLYRGKYAGIGGTYRINKR